MANHTGNDTKFYNIVILGGSYGGISAAHSLLKHTIPGLQRHGPHKVILVSSSSEILCRPACPRAMISDDMFDLSKLFVGIEQAFAQYPSEHFDFVHGTATSLDHEQKTVTVDIVRHGQQKIDFHALVIATGASTPSPLLGLNGDAESLRETWKLFRKNLKTAKSIVIAGGGPAGIETAGELGEYLNGRANWVSTELKNPQVEVTVVTAGKQILPVLRPELAANAEQMLTKVGVTVIKGVRVEKVDPGDAGMAAALTSSARITLSDGRVLETDLYIPATGMKPNTSFVSPALLDANGRVATNSATIRVNNAGPRIYAIGDASSYARPAVHNILEAVPVLSRSMKQDLFASVRGEQANALPANGKAFTPSDGETQLVPIGTKGGVGAIKGWMLPSWAVWMIKGRDYWLWTTPRLWSGRQWEKEA